jgi:hypothetical protein
MVGGFKHLENIKVSWGDEITNMEKSCSKLPTS